MGQINWGRVIAGGLVAGLVMNISETILHMPILGPQMEAHLKNLNLPPITGSAIGVFVVVTFIVGILTVWLYAAIRPRYGAGPGTAACAGLVVWALYYFLPGLGFMTMGVFPSGLVVISMIWSIVEMLIAGVAGAYFYREA
jgi:hypothetical protein